MSEIEMKRFVKWFNHHNGCEGIEQDINIYAAENNLSIINIAPYYFWGTYVLFEKNNPCEGEWITSDISQEKYVCSVCGGACWYYDYQGDVAKSRYCPNCGAKMKGGAE